MWRRRENVDFNVIGAYRRMALIAFADLWFLTGFMPHVMSKVLPTVCEAEHIIVVPETAACAVRASTGR